MYFYINYIILIKLMKFHSDKNYSISGSVMGSKPFWKYKFCTVSYFGITAKYTVPAICRKCQNSEMLSGTCT